MNAANSDLSGYSFSLNIYGGTVDVYSAGQGDNAPLDADGTITLSSSALWSGGRPTRCLSTGRAWQAPWL